MGPEIPFAKVPYLAANIKAVVIVATGTIATAKATKTMAVNFKMLASKLVVQWDSRTGYAKK